jgi:hypothetical protein
VESLREQLRAGFAYSLQPPEWIRGPAVIDGDTVVLEDRQRERYQPQEHAGDMLFDLIAVDQSGDLLGFVRKYGLLWHVPDAVEHRESLEDWRVAVAILRLTVNLLVDLADYISGDMSRTEAIRENELVLSHAASGKPPVLRDELARLASGALAHAVTAGLGDVRTRVVADSEIQGGGEPGLFRYFHEPPHLFAHAFDAVSHLIVQSAPITRCPECGRFFEVLHGRQLYCTPRCAGRARYRRFADKKRIASSAA